jgi:hypothetical protein
LAKSSAISTIAAHHEKSTLAVTVSFTKLDENVMPGKMTPNGVNGVVDIGTSGEHKKV